MLIALIDSDSDQSHALGGSHNSLLIDVEQGIELHILTSCPLPRSHLLQLCLGVCRAPSVTLRGRSPDQPSPLLSEIS